MTAEAPKIPTMYSGGRRYLKAQAAAKMEQSRRSRAARLDKRIKAAKERKELRDYWRNRIAISSGVNIGRVVLTSAVTSKRSKPEYPIRSTKGRYAYKVHRRGIERAD